MRDGSYGLSLIIDRYIGRGTLSLFAGNGQGHDGVFKIEVHVSGAGHALRGVVNVFLVPELARQHDVPEHFSLAVIGSGDDRGFNLIGTGPGDVVVEVDAVWRCVLSTSAVDSWP